MTDLAGTPQAGGNNVWYDSVRTGIKRMSGGFRVYIVYVSADGDSTKDKYELSTRTFRSEGEANEMAQRMAHNVGAKLKR